jgi:hypothetical protein
MLVLSERFSESEPIPCVTTTTSQQSANQKPTLSNMNVKILARALLIPCGLALLNQVPSKAQSWTTVDDFQYYVGKGAWARGLAKDSSGTVIYSAGGGQDETGSWHALVSQSADGGNTWSVIDDFTDPAAAYGMNIFGYGAGIAADSAGRIYASGLDRVSTNASVWITRGSGNGGQTWSTVDRLSGSFAQPQGVATDAAGNVYVAGWTNYPDNGGPNATWVVRKGTIDSSGGITWGNVDAFRGPNSQGARAYAIACHPTAGIFSVGWGYVSVSGKGKTKVQTVAEWVVRRSQNGGATWTTVDTFSLNSQEAIPQGVGIDLRGNIYVVGYASNPYRVWIVRKSADGGNTWATVDSFQPSGLSNSAQANGFGCDAYGNLFVAGTSADSSGHKWVVRESQYSSVTGTWGAWQTVDSYQLTSPYYAEADAVIGDSLGNIFVAGMGQDVQAGHWIVRKH